ncbi:MAG TPA: helix-turn-helix transcriptional regulator [Roseiflexaceae bacterium]|nr:helix-turn-helix transcriptional regulator [Roseiflexaceae bacterium]HMP38850.1 helix-turn-helix transcriptional regulator [Roseiflexaceae bacterium]
MSQGKKRAATGRSFSWNADTIRALRHHLNLTQRQLAEQLEVRQQTISEWETNLHTPHRSTQKLLTLLAEQSGFVFPTTMQPYAAEDPPLEREAGK